MRLQRRRVSRCIQDRGLLSASKIIFNSLELSDDVC
jgi:hypothetical protein